MGAPTTVPPLPTQHNRTHLAVIPHHHHHTHTLHSLPTPPPHWSLPQVHQVALLGLRPAPNSRELRWAAFGPPPSPHADLPPSKNKNKYRELQRKLDAARIGDADAPEAVDGTEGDSRGSGKAGKSCESQSPGLPRAVALQQQQAATAAAAEAEAAAAPASDPQKRLRAVQKKLRQIAALEERQAADKAVAAAAGGRGPVLLPPLLPEEACKLAQRGALEREAAQLEEALRRGGS